MNAAIQHRRDGWLVKAAHDATRHPGLIFGGVFLIVLVFAFWQGIVVLTSWAFLDGTSGGMAERDKQTASAALASILPVGPNRAAFNAAIDSATKAERRQISMLSYAADPLPPLLPPQRAAIHVGSQTGDDTMENSRAFGAAMLAYKASRCPQGLPRRDELATIDTALAKISGNARGLGLMRLQYHRGLIDMCRGRFPEADAKFRMVLNTAKALPSDQRDLPWVKQYIFLASAGAIIATPRSGEAAEVPTLPDETGLNAAGCTRKSPVGQCQLFDWSATQTNLLRLDQLLTSRDGNVGTYQSLRNALLNDSTLDMRGRAALAQAAALFGDFGAIRRLVVNWPQPKPGEVIDCDAAQRLANFAWLAGAARVISGGQYCAANLDLPVTASLTAPDIEALMAWSKLIPFREGLKQGSFVQQIATINASSDDTPDSQRFLDDARTEIMSRLGSSLRDRAESLTTTNGQDTRRAILRILQTGPFDLSTRLEAGLADYWGAPFYSRIWYVLAGLALSVIAIWALWLVLSGYAQLFTQRHHVDRALGLPEPAK